MLPAIEDAADREFDVASWVAGPLPQRAPVHEFSEALHIMVAGRPPVGFARIEAVGGQAHLQQLSVDPAFGRVGIGTALLEAAIEWARESGFCAMTLSTFVYVPFNAPFYARFGFKPTDQLGPELQLIRAGEQSAGLDALGERTVMRLDLGHHTFVPRPRLP